MEKSELQTIIIKMSLIENRNVLGRLFLSEQPFLSQKPLDIQNRDLLRHNFSFSHTLFL